MAISIGITPSKAQLHCKDRKDLSVNLCHLKQYQATSWEVLKEFAEILGFLWYCLPIIAVFAQAKILFVDMFYCNCIYQKFWLNSSL